jgi:hypothetical protein
LHDTQGVVGSSPARPTKKPQATVGVLPVKPRSMSRRQPDDQGQFNWVLKP